ncbi:AfsR/SARP family transcriptional regulator, partial [Streptomyces flavofungini]|uniref:AfsR/SARP family transcriptional regulator n=1 Tax=Streptomyces flavofungini TaxID=68200 RepID=UPI0034E0074C
MSIRFALLGDVVIRSGASDIVPGSPRQRCVLALLAIDVNRPLSLDTLVDRVWGTAPPPRASGTLYSYISRLRALRSAAADREEWDIVRSPAGYTLRADEDLVDLARFRSLAGRARGAPPQEAKRRYGEALALWRGRPFAGLTSDWLDAYRTTLAAEHLRVRLELHELLLDEGRHADLVPALTALATEHPLDERVAHQHILSLYRGGQHAAALAAYERLRQELAEALGVDPGPRLQELHQRMLVSPDELLR